VVEACAAAGNPPTAGRGWFVVDVWLLAQRFAEIMGTPRVQLRLDAPSHALCPRFHVENARSRLICTYRGLGTEFGAWRLAGTPDPLIRMPTGAVAIFRGLRWRSDEVTGVVHRSPAATPGSPRLVLVLEPDEDELDS